MSNNQIAQLIFAGIFIILVFIALTSLLVVKTIEDHTHDLEVEIKYVKVGEIDTLCLFGDTALLNKVPTKSFQEEKEGK